jgi:hypothetical protein
MFHRKTRLYAAYLISSLLYDVDFLAVFFGIDKAGRQKKNTIPADQLVAI